MAWQIHYRKDDRRLVVLADTFDFTLTVACEIIRSGLEIEKLESETGVVVEGHALAAMCEAAC